MREYVGTIAKVPAFLPSCPTQKCSRQLSARLDPSDPTTKISVKAKVKFVGDWAGNLEVGALTQGQVSVTEGRRSKLAAPTLGLLPLESADYRVVP